MTHRDTLLDGEVQIIEGQPVTSPERTAFDIGRRVQVNEGVAHTDALAAATRLKFSDVAELAKRHKGVRGLRRLETVLSLADPGAQSPRETALRLLPLRGGLLRPEIAHLDLKDIRRYELLEQMGWIIVRVVAENRSSEILRRVRSAIDRASMSASVR